MIHLISRRGYATFKFGILVGQPMTSNTKFVCHLLLEVLLELTNHLNMCCLVNLNVNKISLNRLSCRSYRRFNLFTFVFSNLTTKTACIQVSAAAGGHHVGPYYQR